MALSDVDLLRMTLGEVIPTGGSESDTLFSDIQLGAILNASAGLGNKAYLMGWQAKMAAFSELVDVTEGPSSSKFSDLYHAAKDAVDYYRKLVVLDITTDQGKRYGPVLIGSISRIGQRR